MDIGKLMRMTTVPTFLTICIGLMTGVYGAVAVGTAAVASPVHDLCLMSWASEPDARRTCVEQQIEGAQTVARYLDWAKVSAGADGQHVVETYELCQSLWLPDYAMMASCLKHRAAIGPPD